MSLCLLEIVRLFSTDLIGDGTHRALSSSECVDVYCTSLGEIKPLESASATGCVFHKRIAQPGLQRDVLGVLQRLVVPCMGSHGWDPVCFCSVVALRSEPYVLVQRMSSLSSRAQKLANFCMVVLCGG